MEYPRQPQVLAGLVRCLQWEGEGVMGAPQLVLLPPGAQGGGVLHLLMMS